MVNPLPPKAEKVKEYRLFYGSTKKFPKVMRFRLRLSDTVDYEVFKSAVKKALSRYPYFCVQLLKQEGEYYFVPNPREVVVSPNDEKLKIASEQTNGHLLYFGCHEDWISVNIFHALTDGDGAYALIRTVLYYYFSQHLGLTLHHDNIRLSGEDIPEEEFVNPFDKVTPIPAERKPLNPIYNLDKGPYDPIVTHIKIDESQFMAKAKSIGATPNSLISLFLGKALYDYCHLSEEKLRIVVCINERKALHAPLAHHSLVGGVLLDFDNAMNQMPLEDATEIYRAKMKEQSEEEAVLRQVANQKALEQHILSTSGDEKRFGIAKSIIDHSYHAINATVSYVGKANFGDAEAYIKDFHTLVCTNATLLVEIAAVNGTFYIDVIQWFADEDFVPCFLKQFESLDIDYKQENPTPLSLPTVELPWENW